MRVFGTSPPDNLQHGGVSLLHAKEQPLPLNREVDQATGPWIAPTSLRTTPSDKRQPAAAARFKLSSQISNLITQVLVAPPLVSRETETVVHNPKRSENP